MDYQVWIKDEFGDTYTKVDCGDLGAAKREVDIAVRAGKEPILTVEVPYSLAIKVEAVGTEKPKRVPNAQDFIEEGAKEKKVETSKSKTKPGEDTGA